MQKPSISQPEEIWKLFEYYGDEDDIGTISRVFNSITSQNAHFVVGLIDITFDLPQDATWREKLAPLESQIEEHWTTINRTSRESFSSRIKNFLQHKNLSLLKQADIRGVLRVCKAKYIDPLNTPAS
ncbi:MAG: hypothetical protein H6767_04700 [Candidatus Peribacteria bacterium]|nr:MAG: hypothetical protein H6767_04700 [Candidatus Peribacteria bacterium]